MDILHRLNNIVFIETVETFLTNIDWWGKNGAHYQKECISFLVSIRRNINWMRILHIIMRAMHAILYKSNLDCCCPQLYVQTIQMNLNNPSKYAHLDVILEI